MLGQTVGLFMAKIKLPYFFVIRFNEKIAGSIKCVLNFTVCLVYNYRGSLGIYITILTLLHQFYMLPSDPAFRSCAQAFVVFEYVLTQ